ncbi:MAG: hypothetical protein C0624_03685 [Desulfuromonas sp.]|nr:MAG: hypothetical protein C0624_03685 [Desulfuromonas sp.]
MIYIGAETESGCGIYLDVHSVERSGCGQELAAVIGDGLYEGEVLISFGPDFEITYVDSLWGDAKGVRNFLARHGEENIESDIRFALAVDGHAVDSVTGNRGSRPHVYLPLFADPGAVAEMSA